jgi:hypothetical protein
VIGINLSSSEYLTNRVRSPNLTLITTRDLVNVVVLWVGWNSSPLKTVWRVKVRCASIIRVHSTSHSDRSIDGYTEDVSVGAHSDTREFDVSK